MSQKLSASLRELFSDGSSHDGTNNDYDELFRNDGGGGGGTSTNPTEPKEPRGPRVRYDPTLMEVQAYAEREYGYDATRASSFSAFNPDATNRFDLALVKDEMVDVVRAARTRRRCIFGVAAAVIAGSAVLGSSLGLIGRAKHGGGDGDDDESSKSILVAPPEALEEMCSVSNIAREGGHEDCERACNAAACCMAVGTQSCFRAQEELCGMYAPCGILHSQTESGTFYSSYLSSSTEGNDGAVVVPPPPTDLQSQCSDASLSTINGYIACQSACHSGKCCYAELLTEKGDPSHLRPFAGSHVVESCVQSHPDVCMGYAPCHALVETKHDSSQKLVDGTCTAEKIRTREGRDACDDICKARSCCFASSEKRNCRIDNENWCAEYTACEILLQVPPLETHKGEFGDVDVIDSGTMNEDIAYQCQQSLITTRGTLLNCEDACRPALCCFYDDLDCDEDFQRRRCDDYLFCLPIVSKMFDFMDYIGVVDDDDDDLESSASEIGYGGDAEVMDGFEPSDLLGFVVAEACDVENLKMSEGRKDCRLLCEPYLCCTDPGPDGCASDVECPLYQKCKNLLEEGIIPPNTVDLAPARPSGDESAGLNSSEPEINNVVLACSEHYLGKEPRRCAFLCEGMMCCFDYSDKGCFLNPDCLHYQACSVLVENNGDGGIESSSAAALVIEEACDPDNITDPNAKEMCYALCASHLCCFDGSCPQMDDICNDYEMCEVIFRSMVVSGGSDLATNGSMPDPLADLDQVEDSSESGADSDSAAALAIEEACRPETITDAEAKERCYDLCLPHLCCFDGSCLQMDEICNDYDMCEIIFHSMVTNGGIDQATNAGMPDPPAHLNQVCNPNTIDDDDNRRKCEDDCMMANCCRGVGGGCRNMVMFCENFALCETVWDDDGSQPRPPPQPYLPPPSMQQGTGGSSAASTQPEFQYPPTPPAVGSATSDVNDKVDDPKVLCSSENLEKPGGREACDEACDKWECCWGDNSKGEENCFDENSPICLKYLDCPMA